MPLLDHFHGPNVEELPWESVSTMWVAAVTAELNRTLPQRFRAFAHRPDESEVEVWVAERRDQHRRTAVIRFVSPSNKWESNERDDFVKKSQALLDQGIALVVVDIVTEPMENMHNELVRRKWDSGPLITGPVYSASYRTARRDEKTTVEIWPTKLEVGRPLPTVALPLTESIMVALDLEATYANALEQSGA